MKRIFCLPVLFLFSLFTLNSCGLFLQNTAVKNYQLTEKIPKKGFNKYQRDFLYLTKVLEEGYPGLDSVFVYKDRKAMEDAIIYELKSSDDTEMTFNFLTSQYLARLKNQHSWIAYEQHFERVFPFAIHIYQNGWYLVNTEMKHDRLNLGQRIQEINGMATDSIEQRLTEFVFAENRINAQHDLQVKQLYNKPEYLVAIGLIENVAQPLRLLLESGATLSLNAQSTKQEFALHDVSFQANLVTRYKGELYAYDFWPEQGFAYLQFNRAHDQIDVRENISSYVKPWLQPLARNYVNRQFKKKKPSKRIAPYYNPKYPVFKDFVWELVDSLNRSDIGHLVIDLRYNPGGNLTLGKQLLYFLASKEDLKDFSDYAYTSAVYQNYFSEDYKQLEQRYGKTLPSKSLMLLNEPNDLFAEITDPESPYYIPPNRPVFQGQVYALVNSGTGSAAALLTTLLQDNGIGTIIGTSVGNNPIGATTLTPIKLPKTKRSASIASSYMVRPRPELGPYQIPDYWVERSLADLQSGIDPHLQKVIELIKSHQPE